MRPGTRKRLLAAGITSILAAMLAAIMAAPPRTVTLPVRGPFLKRAGAYWTGIVELPSWTSWNRPLSLGIAAFENGHPLGQALMLPIAVAAAPRVRNVAIIPSPGGNPGHDGRAYTVAYHELAVPVPIALALLVAAGGIVFALVGPALERPFTRWPRVARGVRTLSALGLTALLIEGAGAVLLADRLAGEPGNVRGLYEQALGRDAPGTDPGLTALFKSHPYLNFALNPEASYMGERQIAPGYLIRRKEPIRPRQDVPWRILVLGGSSTFGEYTRYEEDTWVYRLEQKLRRVGGPGVDVINGGVGGYNVVDNLVHYLLLLDALAPDVVVLYVGINDVHPRLVGTLARDYTNSRIPWRSDANELPAAHPIWRRAAAYRYALLHAVERQRFANIYGFVQQPPPPIADIPAALARNGPQVFAQHTENLIRLIQAEGRTVVVVPQVFHVLGQTDRAFIVGVQQHNAVLEALARRYHAPYVGTVLSAVRRNDLMDNCHFNRHGHETMAKILARALAPMRPPGTDAPEAAARHNPSRVGS